jgi:hypothetical protein
MINNKNYYFLAQNKKIILFFTNKNINNNKNFLKQSYIMDGNFFFLNFDKK